MYIAINIRAIRQAQHISQSEVANRLVDNGYCAVSAKTIGRWQREEQEIPANAILPLALSLNCSVYRLLCEPKSSNVQDQHVTFDITLLSQHEREIMKYLFAEWDGDKHTLIEFGYLYAVLPPNVREEIAYTGIRLFQDAIKKNILPQRGKDVNIGKIIAGWKNL